MSSALDAFRAQQEAVEALHARLVEVREVVRTIKADADAVVHTDGFRKVLQDEERWLSRAEALVTRVQYFRQAEASRFWPAVWPRWAVAIALATITSFAAGAGYVWAVARTRRNLPTFASARTSATSSRSASCR
jgi:hypothetical protein